MNQPKYREVVLNVSILLVILTLVAVLVHGILDKSEKMGPRALTSANLGRLERYILSFHDEQHVWPNVQSWKTQLQPYIERDRTFPFKKLVTDAWGGDIEYIVRTNGEHSLRILRSLGPNK